MEIHKILQRVFDKLVLIQAFKKVLLILTETIKYTYFFYYITCEKLFFLFARKF